jgi:cyanophycinase
MSLTPGTASKRPLPLRKAVSICGGLILIPVLVFFSDFTGTQPDTLQAEADFRISGGSLVICGGGEVPDEVSDQFLSLAGGRKAKIVIIPTELDTPYDHEAAEEMRASLAKGGASVRILHTLSRDQANDPNFVRPITAASGVWLGGGKQSRLADTYADTLVETELKAVLERGGVVGGNSAGAAAMTSVMISHGWKKAELSRGLDLLPGAVIDQHFLKRNRVNRLMGVMAGHHDLIGLGIDERTAVVVRLLGMRLKVIGESYVVACVPDPEGGRPRIEIMQRGDYTDMIALRDEDDPIRNEYDEEYASK